MTPQDKEFVVPGSAKVISIEDGEFAVEAGCGGSNGIRRRLWKTELQKLANQIGLTITVLHYPRN